MGNFDRGGDRGGFKKGGFGGKPGFKKSFGNDSDRPREMFRATCSECGKNCEVPFRPTNGKPVRCDDCFSVERNSDSRGGRDSFNDRGPRRDFNNDRPAFRPQLDRPAFVPTNSGSNDQTTKALAEISTKLDRLVTAMEKMTNTSAPKAEAKKEEAPLAPRKPEAKKVEVKAEPKKVEAKTAAKKAPAKKAEVKAPAKVAAKKAAPAKKVVAKKKK